jgi:hypothetical protein
MGEFVSRLSSPCFMPLAMNAIVFKVLAVEHFVALRQPAVKIWLLMIVDHPLFSPLL